MTGRSDAAPGQNPDRVLQGREPAAPFRADRVHVARLHVPARPARTRHKATFTAFVPAISSQTLKKTSTQVRCWRLHRWIYPTFGEIAYTITRSWRVGYSATDGSIPPRCTNFWRVSTPTWCADPQQIPTLRRDPRRPRQAHGDHPRVSSDLRALAVGHDRPGEQEDKSPVTGDCHVGYLWEPEDETPSGHPTLHRGRRP